MQFYKQVVYGQRPDHDTGNYVLYSLLSMSVGSTVYRPFPRRLEYPTICKCHCKGIIFSSVILRA